MSANPDHPNRPASVPTDAAPKRGARNWPSKLANHALGSLTKGVFAISLLYAPQSASADPQPSPEETVNALNDVFGRHANTRGSHAKGFCTAGYFDPSAAGADFATSSLFAQETIPVTARFSIGGGNPLASDTSRSVRGLAVRFHMEDREELDLVMISAPVFFAATPAQFVAFLEARTEDPATGQKDAARIEAFNQANPNVMSHLTYVSNTPPPASYATSPYYSAHAFLFANTHQGENAARWILEPVSGFQGLTSEQESNFPDDFLKQEMQDRLADAPAQWNIYLQVAEEGDPLDDPSVAWPETRRRIRVGSLTIDRIVESEAEGDCPGFVFDPNNLTDGIAPTEDPILAIRSPAYAISLLRRLE